MPRTTKREVEAVFERLCATVGVTAHTSDSGPRYTCEDLPAHDDAPIVVRMHHIAGWSLDYNSAYGGWVIAGHSGTGTGESRPCGHERMPAGQFVSAMQFAIQAIYAARELAA